MYLLLYAKFKTVFTLACHALMVPSVLRRAKEAFHGPPYQLMAVELADIWWSCISPLFIPKGTEQPYMQ